MTELIGEVELADSLSDASGAAGASVPPPITQAIAIENVNALTGDALAAFLEALLPEAAAGDFSMGSLFLFSDIARRERQFDVSLAFLQICGARYGRSAVLLEKYGFTYLATADDWKARDAFVEGIALEPENPRIQLGLFFALVRLDELIEALRVVEPIMNRHDLFNPEFFNRSLTHVVHWHFDVGERERIRPFVEVLMRRGVAEPWFEDVISGKPAPVPEPPTSEPPNSDLPESELPTSELPTSELPESESPVTTAEAAAERADAEATLDALVRDDRAGEADTAIPATAAPAAEAFAAAGGAEAPVSDRLADAGARDLADETTAAPAADLAASEPPLAAAPPVDPAPDDGTAEPPAADAEPSADTPARADSGFVIGTIARLAGPELVDFLRSLDGAARFHEFDLGSLLGIADACRSQGVYDVALKALEVALDVYGPSVPLIEKLGFTCLAVRDHEAAHRHFLVGVGLDPADVHLREGLFFATHNLGLRSEAVAIAEPLLVADDLYSPQPFVQALKDDVQGEYLAGGRAQLRPYFEYLRRHAPDNLVSVRLADIYNTIGEFDLAYRIVKPVEDDLLIDPWLACIVSETYIGLQDLAKAEKIMRPLLRRGDFHIRFFNVYIRCFKDKSEIAQRFDEIMSAFADKPEPIREQVAFVLRMRADALGDAFEVFLRNGPEFVTANQYLCLELAYRLLQDGSVIDAEHICEMLERFDQLPFNRMMLKVNILFARQDWAGAKVVLDGIVADNERQRTEVMLKQFELACFCRDFATAADLCRDLMVAGDQIEGVLPSIYRYYGEIKDWGSICALFLRYGAERFNYDQIGSIVFRAFSQTGALPSLLEKINATRNWEASADLRRLRSSVVEQLATDVGSVEAALADPTVAPFEVTRRRLEVKRRLLVSNTPPRSTSGNVIYFCTNKSYRVGTAVAVMSLLKTNLALCQNSKIYIMTDEDDGVSEALFARISQRFLCDIEVKYAASFISDFVNLRSSYGVFTSGFELSESAYYRIFFAKHLVNVGGVKRAIYLDSDLLVTGDIGEMFNLNLRGKALAARREILRPEVELAAAMHGINDEEYFNSGVLVFDASHPEIDACLDRTIKAVYTAELLFHDQCALNIGFFGKVSFLKTRFNYFLPPSTVEVVDSHNADIVHFLDRPKPWHSTYSHPAALMWLDRLLDLSEAIGGDLTMRVLADA